MKKYNVAIVGATGLVGSTFLQVLKDRDFPIENLYLMASAKSAGKIVEYDGKKIVVEELTETSFDKPIDFALFSAGGGTSLKFAPIAASKGVVVIDNSSAWRMDPNVPLVVPEVNPDAAFKHKGIIANPNCSTIQSVVPLKVLDELYGIERVVYSTYQAVSGSGIKGIEDLEKGLEGKEPTNYPHQIAFNCLPHIDVFLEDGYTKEEEKMIKETRKILERPELRVTATCVRVPVKHGHSVSCNIEFAKPIDLDKIREVYRNTKGIILTDDVANNVYPMPINAAGHDEVYVGRLRKDPSIENGLNLWIVADNIRKGAATNAVQIAELLIGRK